jgi:outer membrane protein assembly factor BamB
LIGPIITHRGIKELAIVASASGRVSAVDADLGTIFWTRDLPLAPGTEICTNEEPMGPMVLSSVVAKARTADSTAADDDFSDGNRPVLVATVDGMVHSVRASTGEDFAPAMKLTANRPVLLAGFRDALFAAGAAGCDQRPKELKAVYADGKAVSLASEPSDESIGGMAVATSGDVLLRNPVAPGNGQFPDSNILTFPWRGRNVTVLVDAIRGLLLKSRALGGTDHWETTLADGKSDGEHPEKWTAQGGLATWEDDAGERWICAIATNGRSYRLHAFQLTEIEGKPSAELLWQSAEFARARAPVVAAGVVYCLEGESQGGSGQVKLVAFDAKKGTPLASSSEGLFQGVRVGGLAVANGHLCFAGTDGALYCFGLPIEI